MTTPIQRVAEILQDHYVRLPTPLEIGGLKINVSDAFIGKDDSTDLIIVGDTSEHQPRRLRQTIEGVGRALDMMESRRPLTFVIVGPRPDTAEVAAMSRFARVLPIGEKTDNEHLRNWLAVLLPLELPEPREGFFDIVEGIVPTSNDHPLVRTLLAKVEGGPDAVAAEFHDAIAAPFQDPDIDMQDEVKG